MSAIWRLIICVPTLYTILYSCILRNNITQYSMVITTRIKYIEKTKYAWHLTILKQIQTMLCSVVVGCSRYTCFSDHIYLFDVYNDFIWANTYAVGEKHFPVRSARVSVQCVVVLLLLLLLRCGVVSLNLNKITNTHHGSVGRLWNNIITISAATF